MTENLPTDQYIPPKLVDRLEAAPNEQVDWTRKYIRSMLTDARSYLEARGYIEITADARGGQDTYLWKQLKPYVAEGDSDTL